MPARSAGELIVPLTLALPPRRIVCDELIPLLPDPAIGAQPGQGDDLLYEAVVGRLVPEDAPEFTHRPELDELLRRENVQNIIAEPLGYLATRRRNPLPTLHVRHCAYRLGFIEVQPALPLDAVIPLRRPA